MESPGPFFDNGPYAGMTINERLFAAGLLDRWDAAIVRKDWQEMGSLLTEVGLLPQAAAWTVNEVLFSREMDQRRRELNAMCLAEVAQVFVRQFQGKQPDPSAGKANLIELILGDLRAHR